jgi:soluble lytic murein transglycosylase
MTKALCACTLIAIVQLSASGLHAGQLSPAPATPSAPQNPSATVQAVPALRPTVHPRLPADPAQYWMAPSAAQIKAARTGATAALVEAVTLEIDANYAKALTILMQPAVRQGALADYAAYYQGLAELRLGRAADARRTFEALAAKPPVGFLVEATALRLGETYEALNDHPAALAVYQRLAAARTTAPDDVLMRLAREAKATGDTDKAIDAYSRVLYEFPFADNAAVASDELDRLPVAPIVQGSGRYKLELGRGERLFGAKRYAAAKPVFAALRGLAAGDERELIDLRIAECDYFLKQTRAARDGVRPYIEKASRQGEALFFYALAQRELGDVAEYLRTVRRIADDFPQQSWAEEALNNLATYYIREDEDDLADTTFREMYEKFPTGHYAERAAWKIGWRAYRQANYADTLRVFESAAAFFGRSDYRPAWLYWSARAHEALKNDSAADARYTLVATDYLNSYYGRLAVARLSDRGGRVPKQRLIADVSTGPADDGAISPAALPPNESTVRALLAAELFDQAIDELRYAQKNWGNSAVVEATFGWIYNRQGDLRAGINAMKRAYPQYLASGGEQMPIALQRVRFPINYWPEIRKYASQRDLDPYMVAALINQESTFTADVRSHANAYGLMQLLPSTGRQYARSLRLPRRFSIKMLTTADTNLRMGTAYFADLVRQFGGAHFALATYNAGPNRVTRWIAERPGIEQEEFIDDIPFPETQDYVKKIIGQAEDYRRLYGPAAASAAADDEDEVKPAVATKTPAAKPAGKKPAVKKAPPVKKKSRPAAKPAARKRA